MVHLPFYLQNSGLRKVKVAQQTAATHRKQTGAWGENEENLNSFLARSVSIALVKYFIVTRMCITYTCGFLTKCIIVQALFVSLTSVP